VALVCKKFIVVLYPHRVTRYWTHIGQVALNPEKAMPKNWLTWHDWCDNYLEKHQSP